MRRQPLLKSNDRASYVLSLTEKSSWSDIRPRSAALGRSFTVDICLRGSYSFGVSAWNFHDYSRDIPWGNLTIIANSLISETLSMLFSNPCLARGLKTCCGFVFKVLQPRFQSISTLSICD
jgi:hypothetical protein